MIVIVAVDRGIESTLKAKKLAPNSELQDGISAPENRLTLVSKS
jgi:hypothetical protein